MAQDAASRFRELALSMHGAEQSSHMGAEDFRVNGKIFATLAYVKDELGTLKLTPQQQRDILSENSDGWFEPAPGGWGRMGMTLVRLSAPDDVLRDSLKMAYETTLAKPNRAKRGGEMTRATKRSTRLE